MKDQAIGVAADRFGIVTAAEAEILLRISEGNGCQWSVAPVIRAEFINWLCFDQDARKFLSRGLSLDNCRITGFVDLIHCDLKFPLQFINCSFTEQIWLKSARLKLLSFRGCHLRGMNADSIIVETNVVMSDGFDSQGEVSFRESIVGNSFRADGSTFTCHSTPALVCDRIEVRGGVFLSQKIAKSTFNGEVRFAGADVGGNFDCEGGTFLNGGGVALSAERLRTGGSVFLRECRAEGEVVLAASKIEVMLDCRSAHFQGGERTLNGERMKVGSNALLDLGFSCPKVHLLSADIGGGLRFHAARVGKLDARYLKVGDSLEWTLMTNGAKSFVDLRDARVTSLKDDAASWPESGGMRLDGFKYERFSDSVVDLRARLEWLRRDPGRPPQAYRQLSYAYEQAGRADQAKKVLYHFETITRADQAGAAAFITNHLLKWTIGYGYELWRAGVWMVLLTVAGVGFAFTGFYTKLIAPTDKEANAYFIATDRTPTNYPRFSATMYSIEHTLPVINLGVAANWSADTTAQWPKHRFVEPILRYWFWAQTILGWILSIYFIAGLSGFVKGGR